jgi:hypothetical protein
MDYEISLSDAGFTRRQRIDTAVHTLEGILKGIAIDGIITPKELDELRSWANDNRKLIGSHPFSELIPKIDAAMTDGVIDSEEQADILWVCQNLQSGSIYYDSVTSDIQRLQGILHGILADGVVTDAEIHHLSEWIESHDHLKGCYPYDEIDAVLTAVLRDGAIDSTERESLSQFFEGFVTYSLARRMKNAREGIAPAPKLSGICAVCPELTFPERIYSFTGASTHATRTRIAELVELCGGSFSRAVTPKVHYLIVGAHGNAAWTYACYGRKVEQAMNLRSEGHQVTIAHENDFWDALQDHGYTKG